MFGDLDRRRIFRGSEITRAGQKTRKISIAMVYDSLPRIWIVKTSDSSVVKEYTRANGVLYIPKVGFSTLQFAIFLRPTYTSTPSLGETRRALFVSRSATLSAHIRGGPTSHAYRYGWILGASPSTAIIYRLLRFTQSFSASKL